MMADGLSTPEAEYAKDPKIKKEDILTLMEWASKQSHLPQLSEMEFILFYHCTGYSLQATKDIIDVHYDFKNYAPEFFPGSYFSSALSNYNYWDSAYTIDTRYVTDEKYKVLYAAVLDASKFHCDRTMLEFTKIMFMLTLKKGTCPGYILVLDMKGMSLSHLSTLSVTLLKNYLYFIQEAIQLKVRGLHMVNSNSFMEKLMMIMKPFLKKELLDVIHMHTDINKMFKTSNVKSEFLPKEVGGQSPISINELIAEIKSNLSTYENEVHEMMAKRTDRNKRVFNRKNPHSYDVDVLNGSFRKLEVD